MFGFGIHRYLVRRPSFWVPSYSRPQEPTRNLSLTVSYLLRSLIRFSPNRETRSGRDTPPTSMPDPRTPRGTRREAVNSCAHLFATAVAILVSISLAKPVSAQSIPDLADWERPSILDHPVHPEQADSNVIEQLLASGRSLFLARFNILDGAGRPNATGDSKPTTRLRHDNPLIRTAGPDATSCSGCHNQPVLGGSGDAVANVFVGAQFTDPPTDRIASSVTSERNTISIFGAGAIEMLAREMTEDLHRLRTEGLARAKEIGTPIDVTLESKGVQFGTLRVRPDGMLDGSYVEGVDPDLIVKPFGAKGVVISLREFTINALNQHHGIQAVERFGWERTGRRDFDGDGEESEFSIGQTTALTLFQASLPAPVQTDPLERIRQAPVADGERLFNEVGCAACHVQELPLRTRVFTEPNPFNRPGNLIPGDGLATIQMPLLPAGYGNAVFIGEDGHLWVRALTDLKRHRICDSEDMFLCNEVLRQDHVPVDEFLTTKLWDAGTSSPYCHRGDCSTLGEAILHHAGEATPARRRFQALPANGKAAIVAFLLSHKVEEDTQ